MPIIWKPIISINSQIEGISREDCIPPSFKEIQIGDLIRVKTNMDYGFTFNSLAIPVIWLTHVEWPGKITLDIKPKKLRRYYFGKI